VHWYYPSMAHCQLLWMLWLHHPNEVWSGTVPQLHSRPIVWRNQHLTLSQAVDDLPALQATGTGFRPAAFRSATPLQSSGLGHLPTCTEPSRLPGRCKIVALSTKSICNSWTVSTIAKFLHSGPALGFIQMEHAHYTVRMWKQCAKLYAEIRILCFAVFALCHPTIL